MPCHEASCKQRSQQVSTCTHCRQSVPNAGKHLLTCSKRLVKCTRCFNQIPADQIIAHSVACPSSSSDTVDSSYKHTQKRVATGAPPPPPYPPPKSVHDDVGELSREICTLPAQSSTEEDTATSACKGTQGRHRSDPNREEIFAQRMIRLHELLQCMILTKRSSYPPLDCRCSLPLVISRG